MLAKLFHYLRRYKYKKKTRILPDLNVKDIENSVAAGGQDVFVAELLNNKRDGFFMDIGANDGKRISNSFYFEKELGWSGVCVEPMGSIFEILSKNRDCHLVQGCVSTKPGKARFMEMQGGGDMLSTLETNNHGLTARRLRKNQKRRNAKLVVNEVDCFTFDQVAEKYDVKAIDFLSVDTEGGELEILKSIDFKKYPVKFISVENNFYKDDLKEYLESQGFILLGAFGVDEIYMFGSDRLS